MPEFSKRPSTNSRSRSRGIALYTRDGVWLLPSDSPDWRDGPHGSNGLPSAAQRRRGVRELEASRDRLLAPAMSLLRSRRSK